MKIKDIRLFVNVAMIAILFCQPDTTVGQPQVEPPALKIIESAQAAYMRISNYTDAGEVVEDVNGKLATNRFKIFLAKPNLYRIEWERTQKTHNLTITSTGFIWSIGDGDFLVAGEGVQKMKNRDLTFGAAAGLSSRASLTIPSAFFNVKDANDLAILASNADGLSQQDDENVRASPCYVIKGRRISSGLTMLTTLWIGKDDHLIHQAKTSIGDIGDIPIPESLSPAAREALREERQRSKGKMAVFTETHENISVSRTLDKSVFKVMKGVNP